MSQRLVALRPVVAGVVLLFWFVPARAQLSMEKNPATQRTHLSRQVFLMGTVASLEVRAPDRLTGLQHLSRMVAVLEQTEAQLSNWLPESELSRLNRQSLKEWFSLTPSLCRLMCRLIRLNDETAGAFDPGIGRLLEVWDVRGEGRIPSQAELDHALALAGLRWFSVDQDDCTVRRLLDASLDSGAFGKGEAIDRVARDEGITREVSWFVNLGGQTAASSNSDDPPWTVGIAGPLDRLEPIFELPLRSGSLATSGSLVRDRWVGARRIGHILDPRSGIPADYFGSVVVWHEEALLADVFSTALFVMGPESGFEWAEREAVAACYLFHEEGKLRIKPTSRFCERFASVEGCKLASG